MPPTNTTIPGVGASTAQPPATLPANFNFSQSPASQSSTAQPPATLPANFNFSSSQAPLQPLQDSTAQPNWFQSALSTMAQPFLRTAASVDELALNAQGISHDLFGTTALTPEQEQETASHEYDMGPLGQVKALENPWDAAGVGAQEASYFLPVGAEAETAAKGGVAAVEAAAQSSVFSTLWKGALNLVKQAIPFASTQALGVGSEDIGDGKTVAQATKDTIATYTGTTLGFMAFGAAGNLVKSFAGNLLRNDAVQYASKQVVNVVNKMLNLDPELGAAGDVSAKVMQANTRALQTQATNAGQKLVDATVDAIKIPNVNESSVLGAATDGAMNAAKSAQASAAKGYSAVMSPDVKIDPAALTSVNEAMQRGTDFIEKTPELRTGDNEYTTPPMSQATRDLNPGVNLGIPSEETALSKYITQVQTALKGDVSLRTIDNLHMLGMNANSTIPQENTYIKDIATSLYDSAKTTLDKSPDTKVPLSNGDTKTYGEISSAWTQARQSWLNFNSTISDKLYGDLKSIGNPAELSQKLLASKSPTVTTEALLNKLSPTVKSNFSDLLYNNILDNVTSGSNYAKQGAQLDTWLDNWENTGILKDEHVSALRGVADMMQQDYGDIQNNLKGLLGNETGQVGEAATTAVNTQQQASLLSNITKGIGNRDLFTVNPNGSYDFSNLESVLNGSSLKNEPSLDPLRQALTTVKDLKTVTPAKLGTVLKAGFGGTIALAGHPWIGGSIFLRNAGKLMGKDAADITGNDLAKFTTNLAKNGELTPGILTDILTGKFDAVETAIQRVGGASTGKATTGITNALSPSE